MATSLLVFVDLLLAKEGITDRKAIVVEYNIEVDLFHLLGFESQLVKADFNTKLISTIGSGLAKIGVEMSICDDCKCVLRSIKTKKTLAVASNLEGALMFHDGMVAALDARLHRGLPNFKSKKSKNSFSVPQKCSVDEYKIYIPKFREGIAYFKDRKVKGVVRSGK